MPSLLTWLVAVLFIVAEGAFLAAFGIENVGLQTAVCVALYLGLERDFVPGGLTLAFLLYPVEWMVSGVVGFYSIGLVAVFLLARAVRRNIQSGWGVAKVLLGFVAGLLHGIAMIIAFLVTNPESPVIASILWQLLSAAALVAVGVVVVGRTFRWLDSAAGGRGRKTLLEL